MKIAVVIALAAMLLWGSTGFAQNAVVTVQTVEITPKVERGFSENGTLEAVDEVTLYPRVNGRLIKSFVKQGDSVSPGDPIAELDHRDVDAQISQAEAQIAVAQAQVAQAMAELENAKRERDRYLRLVKEGFSTQQQLDSKETDYRTAKAAVDLSRAQVRQNRANLERLQVDLSEYTLKASIQGIVVNDYARTPGEMISPQTPLARIADISRLKAVIQAPESHARLIEQGMKAFVTIGGTKLEGKVYRVSPFVDPSTRTTQVEVAVENDGDLKPGMFARVFIVEETMENTVMIPMDSVISEEGGSFVFVVEDGKARKKPVSLGRSVGRDVNVQDGLAEGDRLIVLGGKSLSDGDQITIR
ncbi:efflux transporter, RND family, MFP subunit [Dethiosulfovibrio peptidovorans DSM 11002]|uniref:Efflux transporter, RND family, MFP subunit n=1 Tax=Dethiosulfovibrio peptidovorans DSM 11002 TaxID=469381 RepID=D2Z5E1_9BACT|nr:efflux RND transporter periplasmic adaptor subunit [Dethiosulfovibrio peptidovorans]EFC90688.1 efflux transporter, RND family, MFP subunit [Dethiosulfovibrio peptidovorans DSM 11002]